MKRIMLTAGLLSLSLLVQAGQQVDQSLQAKPGERVEVTHVNGKAQIQGWDKNEVKVVGELSDRTKEFIFERRGKTIEVTVKVKKGDNWLSSDDGDDLTIYVPQQSDVSYESVNGDLTMQMLTGDVEVDTINGDMQVSQITGKVDVEVINGDLESQDIIGNLKLNTVNGDVAVDNLQGDSIALETVNGDIKIDGDIDSFRASTVNGDVNLEGNTVSDLKVSSVNGDVHARIKLAQDGRINASSVGGDIKLSFIDAPQAKFIIDGHQGDIVNKLSSDSIKEEKYTGFQSLNFSLGDANGVVRASTIKGKIVLSK